MTAVLGSAPPGGVTWDGPESPDLRTEDIVGDGGRYRIGYRWAMA